MADYEDRKKWRTTFISGVLPKIAAHMAAIEPEKGWMVEPVDDTSRGDTARLKSNDGERIWIGIDDDKRRLSIHGNYGQLPNGRQWIPRDERLEDVDVGISAEKLPSVMAADIIRRALPSYRVCLEAYRARVKSLTEYETATQTLAKELTALSGGAILFPDYRHMRHTAGDEMVGEFADKEDIGISYGSIRVSGTYGRVEVSFTPEGLRKFAAGLKRK